VVSDTGSFKDRASDAIPNSLVVSDETVVRSRVKPESKIEQRPDTVRIRNPAQRGGGNRQSGCFTLEHRVKPSDHIDALSGIVSQTLSVKVRERGEKNDAPRRQGKFAQHSAEVRRQFL
jgi:hypothetical protein